MKRKIKRMAHNAVALSFGAINFFIFGMSISAIDCFDNLLIPFFAMMASGAMSLMFIAANIKDE